MHAANQGKQQHMAEEPQASKVNTDDEKEEDGVPASEDGGAVNEATCQATLDTLAGGQQEQNDRVQSNAHASTSAAASVPGKFLHLFDILQTLGQINCL